MSKAGIIKRIALIAAVLMLLCVSILPTVSYVITKTDPVINTFVPTTYPTGSLTLSKALEHPLGDNYTIPDAVKFLFNIALGADYAGKTVTTDNAGALTADSDGNVSVSLKAGASVTLNGIFEGTSVTVTEKDLAQGFSVKDGQISKNVIISADAVSSVDYINVYSPSDAENTVTLKGKKILHGRPWQNGDSFTFLLEYNDGENWLPIGEKTVTYDPDNGNFNEFDLTRELSSVAFDAVGVYAFRVTEKAGGDETITYDKTVNHFSITVTDNDMDGFLEISSVNASDNATAAENAENGGYTVNVLFNNTFTAPPTPPQGDVVASVAVIKTVKNVGTDTITPEGFEFVLENTETSERSELMTDENGNGIFYLIYDETDVGEHSYKLYEVNTGIENVTYSEKVYDVTVSVAFDENGELCAYIAIDGELTDAPELSFENVYDADVDVPPTGDAALAVITASFAISAVAFALTYRKRRYASRSKTQA